MTQDGAITGTTTITGIFAAGVIGTGARGNNGYRILTWTI